MKIISKKYFTRSLILLALAVAFGAFGAHLIQPKLSVKYFNTYETANFYHFIHALGCLVVIIALDLIASSKVALISRLFITGIILFSGSLYILSFNELLQMPQLKILGAVTPIGGLLFIAAWILSALEFMKK